VPQWRRPRGGRRPPVLLGGGRLPRPRRVPRLVPRGARNTPCLSSRA